ncbi:MAG TPA: sulfite exporter TauE/SafE family protein [Hyphomonadaceae bacterium]|nr:sulfite exporter TauE/SafE family protein [Hyphomonadaceae bacterium]HPN04512.1 sulfite exporter TauE/SafE family protein [Hyphomonadaceae bacterium]
MLIHLPIAQIAVDPLILIAIGGLVGFLSGLFGVGGGFLLTPLLIFYGVPAAVAVSTQANQVLATSIAGVSAHWRERQVDTRLGTLMLMGGLAGSTVGVGVFSLLKYFGVVDATIAVLYIVFLGVIGGLMAWESVGALGGQGGDPGRRTRLRVWMRTLPMKRRFPRSGLYISIIPPICIGFFVGVLAAVLGVGGGFILAPAMVYLLGVPTRVMVGTSLFQIIFLTAYVTFLQATFNGTVDLVLAAVLMLGGVIGARYGAMAGRKLKAAQLRLLLALLVLGIAGRLVYELYVAPVPEYRLEAAS